MKELRRVIEIKASASQVWGILMNFAAYPEWNPFVTEISGEAVEGAKLSVTLTPPGKKSTKMGPRVVNVQENVEFRWLGHLLIPGIFDGEHYFRIESGKGDVVRFVHGERFKGFLVPLLKKMLDTDIAAGFEAFNEALKKRAEAA